jgi:hypothetical protein
VALVEDYQLLSLGRHRRQLCADGRQIIGVGHLPEGDQDRHDDGRSVGLDVEAIEPSGTGVVSARRAATARSCQLGMTNHQQGVTENDR